MKLNTSEDYTYFPDEHMVLLYRDEHDVTDTIVSYIKYNLGKNVKCIYINGDSDSQQIFDELKKLPDYDNYIKNRQLTVTDRHNSYSSGGLFAPEKMFDMLITETKSAIKEGFDGLSVSGEVSWALDYNDGFEKIIEYEWQLNETVFSKYPISSICRYNLDKFTDEMIINIIQAHPLVIWENKLHKNPFYIPVEGYRSNQVKKYQVESLLKNLSEYTSVKDSFQIELKKNEERLLRSQKLAKSGTWEIEIGSNMIWACDQAFVIFGLKTETNLISVNEIEKMIHADDRVMVHKSLMDFINGEKDYNIEYRIWAPKSLQMCYLQSIAEMQYDENGNKTKILGVIIDITERKILEQEKIFFQEQVWTHQKLESVGTLASGVAHEINNPVNGILNYGQIILDSTEPGSDINKFAAEIIYETNRVSSIVKNLLDFSRCSGKQHSYANVDDIIEKTISLVKTVFKNNNIVINVDIAPGISRVKCRSQQIQQVLMNFLTNSRDSLNEKYPEYNENKIINLVCYEFLKDNRKWISISVEDFGIGITECILNRIYDPFFTTKCKEKGTGLGLSISFGIIKEHHGEINVESKEGEYAKFTITIPCDNGWDIE